MAGASLTIDMAPTSDTRDNFLHATTISDSHMLVAADTMEHMPKRANFMGIPAELRVRIYEFLFVPPTTHQADDHCCSSLCNNPYRTIDEGILCFSWTPLYTQLLQANRLIYLEAFPILYRLVELRILLPSYEGVKRLGINNFKQVESLASKVRGQLSRAVIVGDSRWIDCPTGNNEPLNDNMHSFWPRLLLLLPNLKHLRFHFDLHVSVKIEECAFELFKGLVGIPRLEQVEVETCYCYDEDGRWNQEMILGVQQKFAKTFHEEAQRIGKKLKIDVKEPLDRLADEEAL